MSDAKINAMSDVRIAYIQVKRIGRVDNSLKAAGITIELVKKQTYHNLSFRCGRLYDGTIRTSCRIEAAGNTYPVRSILKANGMRWDPKAKVWYAKPNTMNMTAVGALVLRKLAS